MPQPIVQLYHLQHSCPFLGSIYISRTLFSKKWITNITGDRKVTLLQCRIQLGNIYLMDFYQIFTDRLQLTVSAI